MPGKPSLHHQGLLRQMIAFGQGWPIIWAKIENYCHCINDDVIDVLWWSQKLVSDPPSVMTAILSQQAGSDRKQAVIVIM
uniref:Uncharacterized protein n=1 Tax=Oryza barthii TaxID=65489 RepID=A0A0D3HJZ5_9ORYZ